MSKIALSFLFTLFLSSGLNSQNTLYGTLTNETDEALPFSKIKIENASNHETLFTVSDEFGRFRFTNLPSQTYYIDAFCMYHISFRDTLKINQSEIKISIKLRDTSTLKPIDIYYDSPYSSHSMRMVEGLTLTNGKKTQHIDITKTNANTSVDNARELYAKVPGLTIWESDGGGLQLGIGARGLSPSRTAHFNTRQNGYDISADALGYPETYYTPPSEALSSIQLIRGAASLQFGPQFGGMINFKIKDASNEVFQYHGAQTFGSYNLINTFNMVSGTIKRKFTYLAYYQYKQGDGWRDNAGFNQTQAYAQLTYHFTEKMFFRFEQTYMHYLAQQAGGLTETLFNQNPRQSIRARNWFEVDWRISAFNYNWRINPRSTLDIKGFKVDASRMALGNLEKISRADEGKERQLIAGDFNNWGAELRYLKHYPIGKSMKGITALGLRYYQGETTSKQGLASANSDADFNFLNPANLEGSDYVFPSQNVSAFFETIWLINKKLSFSGGMRYEYINTSASGSYRQQILHPLTQEIIFDSTYFEMKNSARDIFLGGFGFSYRVDSDREIYGNIAQNYRGINFSDIRIVNPNQIVDPNIEDERGFNSDLGIRGKFKNGIYDFSVFMMHYNNKIGVVYEKINDYEFARVRTNVGQAYSTGFELFTEKQFMKNDSAKTYFTIFGNISGVYAKYSENNESSLSGNWVELVPPISTKLGLKFNHGRFSESLLATYVHKHFSDGTNAISDPNAIAGIIPSYYVIDLNTTFEWNKNISLKAGINNLTNNAYYTRRATSYPGPGIIPSDGIGFYVTALITL